MKCHFACFCVHDLEVRVPSPVCLCVSAWRPVCLCSLCVGHVLRHLLASTCVTKNKVCPSAQNSWSSFSYLASYDTLHFLASEFSPPSLCRNPKLQLNELKSWVEREAVTPMLHVQLYIFTYINKVLYFLMDYDITVMIQWLY